MNPYLKHKQKGSKLFTVPNLTASTDRCDRCNARALAVAVMKSDQELLFCLHHVEKYMAGLVGAGATIYREVST